MDRPGRIDTAEDKPTTPSWLITVVDALTAATVVVWAVTVYVAVRQHNAASGLADGPIIAVMPWFVLGVAFTAVTLLASIRTRS